MPGADHLRAIPREVLRVLSSKGLEPYTTVNPTVWDDPYAKILDSPTQNPQLQPALETTPNNAEYFQMEACSSDHLRAVPLEVLLLVLPGRGARKLPEARAARARGVWARLRRKGRPGRRAEHRN